MRIWVTRHGQTNLNKKKLMQGLTDEPLNEKGKAQAKAAGLRIGKVHFDAVYTSPLDRAQETAALISGVDRSQIKVDERIIEVDFGKYEQCRYACMGIPMTLYWALPEVFPAPKTVESVQSMVKRSHAFLKEIEQQGYEDVLIVCHGGIIRALCGYLEDRRLGIKWRPKPHNCEIRVYESVDGVHSFIKSYKED